MISSVSYVCLPQQYIAHLQIAPDGAVIKHTRLMSDGLPSLAGQTLLRRERVWSNSHHHLVSNTPRISWRVN